MPAPLTTTFMLIGCAVAAFINDTGGAIVMGAGLVNQVFVEIAAFNALPKESDSGLG
jgi:hypothetical protein